jgi:16S rRNA (guanine527-N7)-methyltransferase
MPEVAGLTALAERFALPAGAANHLDRILKLQAIDPTASTTVKDPEAALDRHVADSLVALELEPVRTAARIADLGAGAGWPGLALAIALPQAQVHLVESQIRHVRYLLAAAEGLPNVTVVHARAEELSETFDVVTARALAALPVLCEYAAPLLADRGVLVAWKGEVPGREAEDGRIAARELGLEPVEIRPVAPYPGAGVRTLHVFRKVAPTPARFPRRAGMAVKRPLGIRRPRR